MHYAVAIFDLDNCLLDARAVGPLFEPAFEAIRQANRHTLTPAVLEQALHQCWFTAFDLVAERYRFTPAMRAAGWQQFSQMQVRAPLQGYPDIGLLPRIPLRRYLVTSGFRRLQDSKIDALGIRPWFEQVLIDAIDDPQDKVGALHGKRPLFEQILAREGCTPQQALVIGDNPLSELAAGRALRATTVQTVRPGVQPWELADHQVEGLEGVLKLLSPAGQRQADALPART
ncbi:HAD family hydrolase [Acidovorax sp. ACV01]|uniref:HAD family hydrolase n=1 Tax=Acidovorax sp. ACV01 TaxID=2769311 RepID=UPI00177C6906|nr:HAD family hydrolase [Acidovorax sp. ACV01]MBD9391418.1 HAD family hydrolase [Acidovorax sp. ACV01]